MRKAAVIAIDAIAIVAGFIFLWVAVTGREANFAYYAAFFCGLYWVKKFVKEEKEEPHE